MIFLFVVDTSASMAQKSAQGGMSYLDCAKAGIEHFIKLQSRTPKPDRHFLVTCKEGLSAIRCGWRHTNAHFLTELKNLKARDLSSIGPALKKCFDLLNRPRLQSNMDSYGYGRLPYLIEPTMIILFTDGSEITNNNGVTDGLSIPTQPPIAGSELTYEQYRWDQRIYSIVMNMRGNEIESKAQKELLELSEATGGKYMVVKNLNHLFQSMEQLNHFGNPGVTVNLRCLPNENEFKPAMHAFVHITSMSGNWPIPESYLPDQRLEPRFAQPTIHVDTNPSTTYISKGKFPIDKYVIDHCKLTQDLMTKYPESSQFKVYIKGSNGGRGDGEPFGFIAKGATHMMLHLLPYNYPRFMPLLEELISHKGNAQPKWRGDWDNYIHSIPSYYLPWLRTAIKRVGIMVNVIPEHLDNSLNYQITAQLQRLKQQSKLESDRWFASLQQAVESEEKDVSKRGFFPFQQLGADEVATQAHINAISISPSDSASTNVSVKKADVTSVLIRGVETLIPSHKENEDLRINKPIIQPKKPKDKLKNAFDINRNGLLQQIHRLHIHLFLPEHTVDDSKHFQPISVMGNYQTVMQSRQVLRATDAWGEDRVENRPMFGNPYRRSSSRQKTPSGIVDESELDVDALQQTTEKVDEQNKIENTSIAVPDGVSMKPQPKQSPLTVSPGDGQTSKREREDKTELSTLEFKKIRLDDSDTPCKDEIIIESLDDLVACHLNDVVIQNTIAHLRRRDLSDQQLAKYLITHLRGNETQRSIAMAEALRRITRYKKQNLVQNLKESSMF